jgi:hypothetical protein
MTRDVQFIPTLLLGLTPIVQAAPQEAVDMDAKREPFGGRFVIDRVTNAEIRPHRPVGQGEVLDFAAEPGVGR